MKTFLTVFSIFIGILTFSQTPFITKWKVTSGSGTEEIKFYVGVSAASILNFEYSVAGGSSGTIPININATTMNAPQIVTLNIPKTSTDTNVNISVAGINQFRLNIQNDTSQISDPIIDNNVTADKLLDVIQFGNTSWLTLNYAFSFTTNLQQITALDQPNFTTIATAVNSQPRLVRMFSKSGVKKIDNINNWDVSMINNFNHLFEFAENFNGDLNNWNIKTTGSPISMYAMFRYAKSFNGKIENWNVSNVDNIGFMFTFAQKFNQPLPNFKALNDLNQTFYGTYDLNQPLTNIDYSQYAGTLGFAQYLTATFSRAPIKNSTLLLKIMSDRVGKQMNYGIVGSGSFNYYDPSSSWRTSGHPLYSIISNLAGYNNVYETNPIYTVGTIYPIKPTINSSYIDSQIGVLRDINLGPEYISEEKYGETPTLGMDAANTNNTIKLDSNNDITLRSRNLFGAFTQNTKIVINGDSFNRGTKPVVFKKNTTYPQDVSKDGTIVYDFTDNHLYVSKNGIWHRADN